MTQRRPRCLLRYTTQLHLIFWDFSSMGHSPLRIDASSIKIPGNVDELALQPTQHSDLWWIFDEFMVNLWWICVELRKFTNLAPAFEDAPIQVHTCLPYSKESTFNQQLYTSIRYLNVSVTTQHRFVGNLGKLFDLFADPHVHICLYA